MTGFNSEASDTVQHIGEQTSLKICPLLHFPSFKDKL